MRYTLAQAMRRLQQSTHAYGVTDLRDAINRAVETLAGMSGWECLRQVLRFSSAGPCFTLPQGAAGLVRACVNGRPTTIRGQDFRFVQSGPGDLSVVPPGYARVKPSNILDDGDSPVMVEPESPFRLFACSDGTDPAPAITVRGLSPDGRMQTVVLPVASAPLYSGSTLVSGQKPEDVAADPTVLQTLSKVTLSDSASEYVTLYAEDADSYDRFPIAVYNPLVAAPRFRRYSLAGIAPGQPLDLLVEARLDPLPLVRPDDQLPFDGIDPIEWIIRADWCMKSSEVDAAKKYTEQAVQWMKAKEVANDTIQTPIIVNSLFDGSMGEISGDAFNV
jgi:hypothetical protein